MALGLSLGLTGGGQSASGPILDVNFVADTYAWGGRTRAYSDLTVALGTPTRTANGLEVDSGDRLLLSNMSWFNGGAGTFLVDWYRADDATTTCALSLSAGSGGSNRLEVEQLTAYTGQAFVTGPNNWAVGTRGSKKQRLIMSYGLGVTGRGAYNADVVTASASTMAAALAPTAMGFGYRHRFGDEYLASGRVERVRYWNRRLADWEIKKLMLVATKSHIHLLGDSFVTAANLLLIRDNFLDDYRIYTMDGVGGSSIIEQLARFTATPQYWDRLVVHTDGGFSDTLAEGVAAVRQIKALCQNGTYLYVQPVPIENTGTAGRIDWDAKVAAVVAEVGTGFYVETLAALQAANDGSANDLADVANGIVPRSLRGVGDLQHLNTAGWTIYAAQIAAKITANGW